MIVPVLCHDAGSRVWGDLVWKAVDKGLIKDLIAGPEAWSARKNRVLADSKRKRLERHYVNRGGHR